MTARGAGWKDLLSAEAYRTWRGRSLWLGLLALGALTVSAALVYRFVEAPFDPDTIHNGFGCLAYAASVGVWVGAVFVVVHASLGMAQERAWGTLQRVLLHPAGRGRVFLVRAGAALAAAAAVFAVVALGATLSAALLYGFGDVVEEIPFGETVAVYTHYGRNFMVNRSLLAGVLCLPPLLATACLGFLFSNLLRRPASALAASVLVYFALELFVKQLSDRLWTVSFNAYTDRFLHVLLGLSRGVSTVTFETGEVAGCLASSAGFAILSLVLSFILFRSKEVD